MKRLLRKIIYLTTKILPVFWSGFFQKTAAFCADALQKKASVKILAR